MKRIYLSPPHLGNMEFEFVQEAFRSNWISTVGPHIEAFEAEIARYAGTKGAIVVSSGTAGLHLALRVHGVGPGDTVFVSTLTFIASVNPIIYQGAEPVFIDSEPDSWNMSPAALERALADARGRTGCPKRSSPSTCTDRVPSMTRSRRFALLTAFRSSRTRPNLWGPSTKADAAGPSAISGCTLLTGTKSLRLRAAGPLYPTISNTCKS